MSLSKKKSRKIVVDGLEYRWSPSQDSGFMILVVQHISGKGKKVEVIISDDKNIIIENGSYSIEFGDTNKLIITPRLVETIVKDSIKLGWNPIEKGPPVQLTLNDKKLIIRRGL